MQFEETTLHALRHPPVLHVKLIADSDVGGFQPAQLDYVPVVEPIPAVQIVQTLFDGSMLANEFEDVQRLKTTGLAGGFE